MAGNENKTEQGQQTQGHAVQGQVVQGQAVPGQAVPGQAVQDRALRGRGLRFVLVDQLRQRGTMTVAEMVAMLAANGFVVDGRASKLISDSLRWELARGRVKRLSRGVYAYGRVPTATSRRIRLFAARCKAWIAAEVLGQRPPPTPPTPEHRRVVGYWYTEDPHRPPWVSLTWLWST